MELDVRELRPGLWRWTATHPEWVPGKDKPGGWGRMVGSVSLEPADPAAPLILFDPLAPADGTPESDRFWKALDRDVARRGRPVAILLANNFHERSAGRVLDRYRRDPGAEVWAHADAVPRLEVAVDHTFRETASLPGGVTAHPIPGLERSETIYHIGAHAALVAADALIGAGGGRVRVPPPWWAEDTPEGAARYRDELRPSLRRLLELPIERILVSHGEPVLAGGAAALREALDSPPWGE